MADFDVLLNGAPVVGKVVFQSTASDSRQFIVASKRGAQGAGQLVSIDTSCVSYISDVVGKLDSTGHWSFIVGPGFGLKGDLTLTISVGASNQKITIAIQLV